MPDIRGTYEEKIPGVLEAGEQEVKEGQAAVEQVEGDIARRESRSEADIQRALNRVESSKQETLGVAEAGKEYVTGLPERVKADTNELITKFQQQSEIDVNRIESIGREAADAAMQGKNSAAQAAVSAQQNSTRNAIAQINADPNIPASRKTAMIANIQSQSSMAIAATVGANIKDFTAMQVGALTATMQSVGSALESRNQVTGQLAGASIAAVAGAHETAAQLNKGYDDMKSQAIANADQMKFNYNQLRIGMRQSNNQAGLALLGEKARVSALPLDFKMLDLNLSMKAITDSFAMDMQEKGLSIAERQVAEAQRGALLQAIMSFAQIL